MKYLCFIFLAWVLTSFHVGSTLADRLTYIIHMDKFAMPKAFATHRDWYSSTIKSIGVAGATNSTSPLSMPRLLYTYVNAINGFSAVISFEELQKLQHSHGFVSAYPDKIVKLLTTHTPEFLSLNDVYGLWPASNYGKDVIIGMMDSGVRPESKSFNDDGMTEVSARWNGICQAGYNFNSSMCNRKLIGARYFDTGAKAANLHSEIEGDSPRDYDGHGTHTSTTAAGNYVKGVSFFGYAKGTARGIAPRARLAMYKVAGTVGAGSDLLAGMDQAIADGVDVISISLAIGRPPLYEDPIAIAGFAAMERGIFVSAGAGNDGPFPMRVLNAAPWLLTVGASTIDRQNSAVLTFGNGMSSIGLSEFPANALLKDVPIVYKESLLACNSSELLTEANGKVVICSEEFGYLARQIQEITNSKVSGAIFVSSDTTYLDKDFMTCPGVVIKPADALQIINYAKSASNPTVTMKFQKEVLGVKPAPAVSSFSSRGPSLTNPTILKPDLIAPGSRVLAAWIPTTVSAFLGPNIGLPSDYSLVSGTSMACPHASGVAALLKGAHPEWSPAAIRSAMMTTASQVGNDYSPIRDSGANLTYATPLDTGAGQIDPNKALDPGLIYDVNAQDYVNYLCLMNFTRTQISTITRSHIYNCLNASDLNYPSFMAFIQNTPSSTVYEFRRTVTNVGNEVATYKANVAAPCGTSISVRPDRLVFTEKNQKVSFNVSLEIKLIGKVMAHGSLVWEQVGGNHTVRSPVVVYKNV